MVEQQRVIDVRSWKRAWRRHKRLRQLCSLLIVERRVRTVACSGGDSCRYVDVEVVRTLNVKTANLYVIRCWTGSQCSWRSSDLVCDRLAPEERSKRHCSAHVEASGCCWLEHHGAQRCSSRFLTGSDCIQANVRASSVVMSYGLCVIVAARSRHCRHVFVKGQTSIKHNFQYFHFISSFRC